MRAEEQHKVIRQRKVEPGSDFAALQHDVIWQGLSILKFGFLYNELSNAADS